MAKAKEQDALDKANCVKIKNKIKSGEGTEIHHKENKNNKMRKIEKYEGYKRVNIKIAKCLLITYYYRKSPENIAISLFQLYSFNPLSIHMQKLVSKIIKQRKTKKDVFAYNNYKIKK